MGNVLISDHPLVQHKVARLRDAGTSCPQFRELVYEISQILFYEATRDVRLRSITLTTPMATCLGQEVAESIGLVPVLRAGLGMASAMLDAYPEAIVYHLGLYRDHTTLKPVEYYNKLPVNHRLDLALVLDPMLATGGSAIAALDIMKKAGVPRMKFLGLIGAPEGVAALQASHPEVELHLAALDSHLNEKGYIVPGLGDAGDRQFGTNPD